MSTWSLDGKKIVLIGFGLGAGAAAVALCSGERTPAVIAVAWCGGLLAAICLSLLARLHLRRDLVPDYLSLCQGSFFERDGFCFAISLEREDETAMFTVMYQNRFTGQPSVASTSPLRPCGQQFDDGLADDRMRAGRFRRGKVSRGDSRTAPRQDRHLRDRRPDRLSARQGPRSPLPRGPRRASRLTLPQPGGCDEGASACDAGAHCLLLGDRHPLDAPNGGGRIRARRRDQPAAEGIRGACRRTSRSWYAMER